MSITLILVLLIAAALIVAMVGMGLHLRRIPRAPESHVVLDQLEQHRLRMEEVNRDLRDELAMWRDLEGGLRQRILEADAEVQSHSRRRGDIPPPLAPGRGVEC